MSTRLDFSGSVYRKELVSCREKSGQGFKQAKDRLTVLGCTNATGTRKLKPVLIGKSAKVKHYTGTEFICWI